jgi:hypothetical protein
LAGGDAAAGAVGFAVHGEAAGPADAFTTIVSEGDGFLALPGEVIIHHVEHFEERHVGIQVRGGIRLE